MALKEFYLGSVGPLLHDDVAFPSAFSSEAPISPGVGSLTTHAALLGDIVDYRHIYIITIETGATYTVGDVDLVVCNRGSAMAVTLPVASGSGRLIIVKNINTGTVTVDGNGSDTIDGDLTQELLQWEAIGMIDYVANAWVIV
jgi:hypothetical protein